MKLPSFSAVNYFMHVCAFAELCITGLGSPLAFMVAPGEQELPDPVFYPEDPSTAAPILVRISVILMVALVFLVPALWVLTVHLASAKKGSRTIGWCVLGFAFIVCLEGLLVSCGGPSRQVPPEWMVGYAATFGLATATSIYLILYAKWIYGLKLHTPMPDAASAELEADDGIDLRISPETRQLLGRLALFTFVVLFALLVTAILSLFPQFQEKPNYIAIGFFGVVACGMIVTGLMQEDTIAKMIPWFKGGNS